MEAVLVIPLDYLFEEIPTSRIMSLDDEEYLKRRADIDNHLDSRSLCFR